MAENIRSVVVKIEVDTNEQTYVRRLTWRENETREEIKRRVVDMIDELLELS